MTSKFLKMKFYFLRKVLYDMVPSLFSFIFYCSSQVQPLQSHSDNLPFHDTMKARNSVPLFVPCVPSGSNALCPILQNGFPSSFKMKCEHHYSKVDERFCFGITQFWVRVLTLTPAV